MDLKDKIELIKGSSSKEILNGGDHNGTPLLKYVFEVHQEVFGSACKSCSELLPGYILKIQNINLNIEIMSAKDRKYRMKSGSVIHQKGTNNYYSDLNLTDDIAEKLLKVNPNRAALFAKMPKGALEKLAKEKADEEKAAEQAKIDEAARLAKEEEDRKAEEQKTAEQAKTDAANKQIPVKSDEPEKDPAPKMEKVPNAPAESVEVNDAEEVLSEEKASAKTEEAKEKADEDLTFTELREKYPDIKARSKEGFLEDLEKSRK